jgi:hydrogenase maturation protein HypF
MSCAPESQRILLGGQVQGVGFRPFVFRLATDLGLHGWVRNVTGQVEILAQAESGLLDAFLDGLIHHAPPLARPVLIEKGAAASPVLKDFRIVASTSCEDPDVHVPPDYFACPDCIRELHDPGDRRYRYPFINCTQCGPRYTIIDELPYDRPATSMRDFPLCAACQVEYSDPANRRFHAEPVACPECGPQLELLTAGGQRLHREAALAAAVALLAAGKIVALRGIGGYHLLCDARNETAVVRLRERKRRPHKPLAVMLPAAGDDGADQVRAFSCAGAMEIAAITDPRRPIVLCPRAEPDRLAESLAPGLDEVGLLLAYSPLHELLLADFGGPLVATSGNISGEPVLTEAHDAEQRLSAVADAFLHHNRPIRRPADDAVVRVLAGAPALLRPGRGFAPLERRLPVALLEPLLAVGGHMKNTVAIGWGERAVLSPHVGDLDSPRSLAVFRQVGVDLARLHGVEPARLVHDAHPGYASTRWAQHDGRECLAVPHHQAHASALAGEHGLTGEMLVFTWDGTGYGEDGSLWGGEALLGAPGRWHRRASLRPFRLPGGDTAGREPWRAAAALCWELGRDCPGLDGLQVDTRLAQQAWQAGLNTPVSSSAGRLFDAGAFLVGLGAHASFEGQGPMALEALARRATASVAGEALPLESDASGIWRADWAPLLAELLDERCEPAQRAFRLHARLAATLVAQALRIREQHGLCTVGLSGGVFQNRLLVALAVMGLEQQGFRVVLARQVPCNDGGIAYGQLVEAAARLASGEANGPGN